MCVSSGDMMLFSMWLQVADMTCGVDGNSVTDLKDWEGEFFPNISYIKYEVCEFKGQGSFLPPGS
jgi:hypothetical protein